MQLIIETYIFNKIEVVNIKRLYIIFAVFIVLVSTGCKDNVTNIENSSYKIVQRQELPQEVRDWFDGFENKEAAYVYQHPNYTYIKISGGNNKRVVVKGYTDVDYIKTIYIALVDSKAKENSIYIKTYSEYISSYKVTTKEKDLIPQEKVIFAIIESPKIGEKIANPVNIKGKIAAFEGSFIIRIVDDNNKIIKEEYGQTAGAPQWGGFDISVKYPTASSSEGRVELGEYSPKDGSYISHASNKIIFEQ